MMGEPDFCRDILETRIKGILKEHLKISRDITFLQVDKLLCLISFIVCSPQRAAWYWGAHCEPSINNYRQKGLYCNCCTCTQASARHILWLHFAFSRHQYLKCLDDGPRARFTKCMLNIVFFSPPCTMVIFRASICGSSTLHHWANGK